MVHVLSSGFQGSGELPLQSWMDAEVMLAMQVGVAT
jgi:hypothetical protein